MSTEREKIDGVDFLCPFCGLHARVFIDDDGYAVHAEPTCKTFNDLDPLQYIEAVNAKMRAEGQPS